MQGLAGYETWALKMYDAVGKPPSGLMLDKVNWLGSWQECAEVKAGIQQNATARIGDRLPFGGKYCHVYYTLEDSIKGDNSQHIEAGTDKAKQPHYISYSQWRSQKQLQKAPPLHVQQNGISPTANHELQQKTNGCLSKDRLDHVEYEIGGKSETENQAEQKRELGIASRLLLSFSVYTNATKLLDTRQPQGSLAFVNGIRFLSMTWVIAGHTYELVPPSTDNFPRFYKNNPLGRLSYMVILNGTLSVDTFFVLSGLLLTYLSMKELEKCGGVRRFKWGLFYFHRFWRLTPAYMLTLMVYASLNKYWGNGPLWQPEGVAGADCRNWWTNLLYVNNLVNSDKMCMWWSWYLANDMQFFIISPLMLIPLFHMPLVGSAVCLAFLLINAVSAGLVSTHYELPAAFYFDITKYKDYILNYYIKPWCRIGPYVVGVFAGYLLYKWQSRIKLPMIISLGLWAVAGTLGATVVYGLYSERGEDAPPSVEVAALYNAMARSVWGVCLSWMVLACATGNGGPINHLLSWPGFVPLSRLSYCTYLVHPILMYIYMNSVRTLIHGHDYSMVYMYLTIGHICVSYAVAFIVSLSFEAPMMALEKALLGRDKSR